jgi:hypothetical protein
MKKFFLFPIFLLSIIVSNAQSASYHFVEEFYFVKEISVINYRGKQFRYEIAVKSNPADTLSKVRIHGIASGKGKEDFLKSNFILETREEQDWTIYTIAGKIQDESYKLLFYASVNGNGDFYFDDVNFYVEETKSKWRQVPLFNHSFEITKPDIFAGYYVSKRRQQGLLVHLSGEIYKTGNLSLNIKTSGYIPVSGLVQQVVNLIPETADDLSFHQEFIDVAPYFMIFRTKKESPEKGPLVSKSQSKSKNNHPKKF